MSADLTFSALMKVMGSKKGLDPIPPDQHSWQMKDGQTPLHRLWSWMCGHCIAKGHRHGYAVDAHGKALTIEQAAADLDMDPGVCRRAWREGEGIGLWHKGTHAKDRRYLYLNGEVVPVALEPEEDGDGQGYEKGLYRPFPPYILKQIKKLPKEERE